MFAYKGIWINILKIGDFYVKKIIIQNDQNSCHLGGSKLMKNEIILN